MRKRNTAIAESTERCCRCGRELEPDGDCAHCRSEAAQAERDREVAAFLDWEMEHYGEGPDYDGPQG